MRTSTPAILALLLAPIFVPSGPAVAAPPPLKGTYWSDGMGAVQFEADGDRLVGRFQHSGACGFEPTRMVIQGEFEGSMLAGSVTLCQSGSGCKERTYPVLALYNPQDGSLTAQVKLESGCFSPVLRGGALRLEVAGEAEREARPAGLDKRDGKAQRKKDARFIELASQGILRADAFLKSGDYDAAAQEFSRAVSYQDTGYAAYVAYNGLGVTEFYSGNILAALRAYERARALSPSEADTYINIAAVYARLGDRSRALENVRLALRYNLQNPELITHDQDLRRLLGADPEFGKIVESIGARAKGTPP